MLKSAILLQPAICATSCFMPEIDTRTGWTILVCSLYTDKYKCLKRNISGPAHNKHTINMVLVQETQGNT